MNLRRIARAISKCVDASTSRGHIYRVMVAEVAEPGALEQLWGVDRILDREIVQWCLDRIPDPAEPSPSRVGAALDSDEIQGLMEVQ